MSEKAKDIKVDDDLYSRSIFTFGMETMKKLSSMKVIIIGMRGLGVETAKNIILSGPGEVDIFDPSPVKINDLGSNFYLTEADINKKRDEACVEKLSRLNPYVNVSVLKIESKSDMNEYIKCYCQKLEKYNVVVFTELHPMYFVDQVDKMCREKNIKLIYGICLGLVGYIFTDFGPKHIIFDETGREIKTFLVKSITKDKNGLVTIDNIQGTNDLNIGDGDYVKFKNVEGMEELNDEKKDFRIRMKDHQSFFIGDTSNFSEYKKGGIVYEIKKPKTYQYYPFCQRALMICDDYHPFNFFDSNKSGRSELLYMALSAIHDFYLQNSCKLPELNNMEQAKKICENVKLIYENAKKNNYVCYKNIQEFDEKVVLNTIRWSSANISPVCAFFGGIIAQQIIKATGKYIPIDQWLIYDFFEVVENLNDKIDRTLKNSRYDDQIAIFGNEIQENIQKSNIFMIGAGATGCEFLKNFAMMGFCSDKNSKFTVTDNDNIEISNLSRQFLFNKNNVGQSKSIVAIKSVKEMNPNLNGEGLQAKVCEETESIFNQEFWTKQNFIIYAVDSAEARKYIDNNVILYHKIGVDSGTLGTEAHSNIFIPYKTVTYSDIEQTSTKRTLPVCTLRHFPSLIQHCIEWSKDSFSGYFGNVIQEVKSFFQDFNKFKENIRREGTYQYKLERLKLFKNHIDIIKNKDLPKMCEYAIGIYTKNFDHNIQYLLITYPPDCKTKDGQDFWVGSKKLPHSIPFNIDDDLCLLYVSKFVFILSHCLGLNFTKEELSQENIKKICQKIKVPEFIKRKLVIDMNEENKNKPTEYEKSPLDNEEKAKIEFEKMLTELESIKREEFDSNKINQEEFEKDHDENGHIDFIHAGAILRARNYKIEECDRNYTKQISGNIIPTILTTTASIAAVSSIQLYTSFQTNENKYFRDCYFNLNNDYFFLSPPQPPIKMQDKEGMYKVIPEGWNVWDIIEIKGSKTCGEFCECLKEKYDTIVDIISIGDKMIYATFLDIKSNINTKIEDVYKNIIEKELPETTNFFIINVGGNILKTKFGDKTYENVSVLLPKIKYIFK